MTAMSPRAAVAVSAALLCLFIPAVAEQGRKPTPVEPMVFEYQGLVDPNLVVAEERRAARVAEDTALSAEWRADAFNARAIWRYFRGQYDLALEDLDEAIKLHPKAAYYSNRGVMHRKLAVAARTPQDRQRHWKQAKDDYRKALEMTQGRAACANNNLGWLLVLEANRQSDEDRRDELLQRAKEHLRKAATTTGEAQSPLPLAQVNLAAACIRQDNLKAARKHLEAVAGQVDRAEAPWTEQCRLLNLGELARCSGDWETAARLYKQAYELGRPSHLPPPSAQLNDPKNTEADKSPWILQRLGAARFLLGWYEQAYQDLTTAAEKFGRRTVAGRYAALLAALAQAREAGKDKIDAPAEVSRPKTWIDALEMYLADRLSAHSLKGAARDEDPAAERAKKCEMYYYMGEKRLLESHGNLDERSRELFKKAVAAGEPHRLERTMAQYRLEGQ